MSPFLEAAAFGLAFAANLAALGYLIHACSAAVEAQARATLYRQAAGGHGPGAHPAPGAPLLVNVPRQQTAAEALPSVRGGRGKAEA